MNDQEISDQEFNAKLDRKIRTWKGIITASWFLFVVGVLGSIYEIYHPDFWDSHPDIIPLIIGFLGLFAGYIEIWDTKRRKR